MIVGICLFGGDIRLFADGRLPPMQSDSLGRTQRRNNIVPCPESIVQGLSNRRVFSCTANAVQEESMQRGSLSKVERKLGPAVWQFRWSDKGPQGQRIYRKRVIGTVEEYEDAESARRFVRGLFPELTHRSEEHTSELQS